MPTSLRFRTVRRLRAPLLPLLALSAAACDGAALSGAAPVHFRAPSTQALRAELTTPGSCDALVERLRADAVEALETDAWQYATMPVDFAWPSFDAGAVVSPGGPPATDSSTGAPRHTETNTQVAGVDEADFIESDGRRLYLLHDAALHIVSTDPPGSAEPVATVPIEGSPLGLFVEGGVAVVLSSVYTGSGWGGGTVDAGVVDPSDGSVVTEPIDAGPAPAFDGGVTEPTDPGDGGPIGVPAPPPYDLPYWGYGRAEVKITVLDVTTDAPVVTAERYQEGWYVAARRHGDVVRVVVQRDDDGVVTEPPPAGYDPATYAPLPEADYERALAAWRDRVKASIEARSLADFLGRGSHVEGGVRVDDPIDCGAVHVPPTGVVARGEVDLLELSMTAPDTARRTSIRGRADTVFASHDQLLIAQQDARFVDFAGVSEQTTVLHTFDLTGPTLTYRASGTIPGTVRSPYAFDERGGVVRVVSTEQRYAEVPDLGARPFFVPTDTLSHVSTLGTSGRTLSVLGKTPGFGAGETVQSSRFVGDRAYVVTFRQIDPLFVVDLADATRPTVLGELHIPGFSTYMHPLADDMLLTIGVEVPVDGVGVSGLSLQLFDVRDPTAPALVHKRVLPDASSNAQWEPKDFTYDAERSLLAIPVTSYGTVFRSSLDLFHVDVASGFSAVGSIDHGPEFDGCLDPYGLYACGYSASMRRGLFVGESVYAVSYAAITAHPVADVSVRTATLPLPSPYVWYAPFELLRD